MGRTLVTTDRIDRLAISRRSLKDTIIPIISLNRAMASCVVSVSLGWYIFLGIARLNCGLVLGARHLLQARRRLVKPHGHSYVNMTEEERRAEVFTEVPLWPEAGTTHYKYYSSPLHSSTFMRSQAQPQWDTMWGFRRRTNPLPYSPRADLL